MNTKLGNWLRGVSALALVSVFANSASAATPVAVWDGDFSETTKGDYTLDVCGNTVADDGATITINKTSATSGVKVSWTTGFNPLTVMIRYTSTLSAPSDLSVLAVAGTGTTTQLGNRCGVCLKKNELYTIGYWQGSTGSRATNTTAIATAAGTLIFNYKSDNGSENDWSKGTNLKQLVDDAVTVIHAEGGCVGSGDKSTSVTIGGNYSNNGNNYDGFVIAGIAIFNANVSEDEIKSYKWPSKSKYVGTATGTLSGFSAATWEGGNVFPNAGDSFGYVTLTLTGDTTITVDEVSECASFKLVGSHDFTIAGSGSFKCPILDLSDFTGNLTLKSTTTSSAITVPNGRIYTLDGGTYSGAITVVDGAQLRGPVKLPAGTVVESGAVLGVTVPDATPANVKGFTAVGPISLDGVEFRILGGGLPTGVSTDEFVLLSSTGAISGIPSFLIDPTPTGDRRWQLLQTANKISLQQHSDGTVISIR